MRTREFNVEARMVFDPIPPQAIVDALMDQVAAFDKIADDVTYWSVIGDLSAGVVTLELTIVAKSQKVAIRRGDVIVQTAVEMLKYQPTAAPQMVAA